MAYVSALNIGGTSYDIYANSATSATTALSASGAGSATNANSAAVAASAAAADKLKTARTIAASSDVTWSVSFDGSSSVTGKATINNVPWSAASALSNSTIDATQSTGFASPSAVAKAIADKVAGVYKVKGTKSVAEINALTGASDVTIGDVYNVSDAGTITAGGTSVTVNAGDNVVYTSASTTEKGWDKLAATIDTSNFALITGNYSGTTNGITALSARGAYSAAYANSAYTALSASTAKYASGAGSATKAVSASYSLNTSAVGGVTATSVLNSAYSGYAASSWINTNGTNITNSAKSGAAASAYITASSGDFLNSAHSAYSKIGVWTAAATEVTAAASSFDDKFAFSAWGSNISLTATSDANGNPVIGISAKDTNDNTKYSLSAGNGLSANYSSNGSTTAMKIVGVAATSAAVGVTKASYVSGNTAYIF